MKMRQITDCTDIAGKYVLVRGSLNLPLQDGRPTDTFRLSRLLPTLTYLKEQGARTILVGHIGRAPEATLYPVLEELTTCVPVRWAGDIRSDSFMEARAAMHDGDIIMAENLRQHPEEAENEPGFAAYLASLADLYVNEAFANAHRDHASMVGVPALIPGYAGITCASEVAELSRVMHPHRPALFMIGGAKFATKLPLVTKYLTLYDHVFVGGALANDIFKARGYEVGQSLVSDVVLDSSLATHPHLLVPIDVLVEGPNGIRSCTPDMVAPNEIIKDAGPLTVDLLRQYLEHAATIVWNGPLGQFEAGYREQTETIARLVASAKGYSVVGGGDTIAAIEHLGLNDQFNFLSTGGGAMLTFLEYGTTPALEYLREGVEE